MYFFEADAGSEARWESGVVERWKVMRGPRGEAEMNT